MRDKPQLVKTGEEPDWLAGISYKSVKANRKGTRTRVGIRVFLSGYPVPQERRRWKGDPLEHMIANRHYFLEEKDENPRLSYALTELKGENWSYIIHEKNPRVVHMFGWVEGNLKPNLVYLKSVMAQFAETTRRWNACEKLMEQREMVEQAFNRFRGGTEVRLNERFEPPEGCLIKGGKGKRQAVVIDVCLEQAYFDYWVPRFIVAIQPKSSGNGLVFDVSKCGDPKKRIGGGMAVNIENVLRRSKEILRKHGAPVRKRVVRVTYE